MKIFAELRTMETEEALSTKREYRELVESIAKGDDPNLEKAKEVLGRAGKTSDDLREDVKRMEHRNNLRVAWRKSDEFNLRLTKAQKAQRKADEELAAHQEAYDEKVWPIQGEIQICSQGLHEAENAKRELLLECSSELRDQHRKLSDERDAANTLIKEAHRKGRTEEATKFKYAMLEIESKIEELERKMLED